MSLKTRKQKIQQAAKGVVSNYGDYKEKRRFGLRSVTNPATNYEVEVVWGKAVTDLLSYPIAKCNCNKIVANTTSNPGGHEACKGNSNGHVCYHVLASLARAAQNKDKKLVLFDSGQDAIRYSNFGGQLIGIQSKQGKGIMWGVVR